MRVMAIFRQPSLLGDKPKDRHPIARTRYAATLGLKPGFLFRSVGSPSPSSQAQGCNFFHTVLLEWTAVESIPVLTVQESLECEEGPLTSSEQYRPLNPRATCLSCGVVAAVVFVLTLGFAGAPSAQGQTLKVLHSFSLSDGQNPIKGLVRDATGNLYGSPPYGGIYDENCDPEFGGGAVFKLNRAGKFTVLHAFDNQGDGCGPLSLIEDAAGNLYGTTSWNLASNFYGGGTVFKIDAHGKFRVIYTFAGTSDGNAPNSLTRGVQGNLFGTTQLGGDINCDSGKGCGTVFELNTNGNESVVYSFTGSPDGFEPQSGVVGDARGDFYGTTTHGGYRTCSNGCGTVFQVNQHGIETLLYAFKGGADGANPGMGKLLFVMPGKLYGTHANGGDPSCIGGLGCGVVFEVDGDGTESVLHAFNGADG